MRFHDGLLKRGRRELLRSEAVDIDYRLRESLRRFQREVVPDAARDGPMRILARELLGISAGFQVWRAIGIAFEGNRGHADDWCFGQLLFQIAVLGFTLSQPEPPPIVMDHDDDVIWIVEGRCTAIERRIVEF